MKPRELCRGITARDAAGEPCEPDAPAAMSWSLLGTTFVGSPRQYDRLVGRGVCQFLDPIRNWNDAPGRTKEEVLALCLRAESCLRPDMKLSEFFGAHDWCAGALARDRSNRPCLPRARQARSWSLAGALCLVLDQRIYERAHPHFVRAIREAERATIAE